MSPEKPLEPRVIDVHAHLVPPAVIDELRTRPSSFPSIAVTTDSQGKLGFRFAGLPDSPPMPDRMREWQSALTWQDEQGIDLQVVGPWTDLFGYTLAPDEGTAWSRFFNEAMVEAATAHDRLAPLGMVPLQAPKHAVLELEAARAMGCVGVMIGTSTPHLELDESPMHEFWEAAADLRMPVFVHPIFLHRDPRLEVYGLPNALGRAQETLLAISRLMFSGILLRYEQLALIVAHGGAGLPSFLGRLCRNFELEPFGRGDPAASFRRLYFDSVVIDPGVLRDLIARAGSDHVLLGSDYPFPWEPEPRRVVEQAELSSEVTEQILGANARQLFDLQRWR